MAKNISPSEKIEQVLQSCYDKSEEIAKLLKAMGHPVRVLILQIIRKSQCNVTSLEKALKISQSSVSQHLRILRQAGLIKPMRQGKDICYSLIDERIGAILDIFK